MLRAALIFSILSMMTPWAMAAPPPFVPGERLVFELKWTVFPAGEAVLEVLPMTVVNGEESYHFSLTVTSNEFVDAFYKVRDKIESFTDTKVARSLGYSKDQQEGKHRRQERITFDWKNRIAQYANFGETRPPIPLQAGTLDPLSAFYYTRMVPITDGEYLVRPVTDGKKTVMGRARVVRRETLMMGGKSVETFLIEPELTGIGGVFEKSPDAKIQLWVTADYRRIPVRLKSRVVVGSFVGDLISATGLTGN